MTAMDVFEDYARRGSRIRALEERIRRWEAAAEASPTRQLGEGGRGSVDSGTRMLDYVGKIWELREELAASRKAREEDRICALYLAEMMPEALGGVMTRAFLEGMTAREIARDLGYSESHIKRLKREGREFCAKMQVLYWDRVHVPAVSLE